MTHDIAATWERLVRFHRMATVAMDTRLRDEFGYSLDDYDVLHQVRTHDGPIRMGDLAQRLLIANSSCHRIVGRLADDGFLERFPGADDRRQVFIRLTETGTRQWRSMAVVHTRHIERLVGTGLPKSDQVDLDRILNCLLTTQSTSSD